MPLVLPPPCSHVIENSSVDGQSVGAEITRAYMALREAGTFCSFSDIGEARTHNCRDVCIHTRK